MTHFEQYKKLIQKEAWKYAKKWNVDYDEMESEGFFIYCKALKTWKPDKGSFATHLYFELMNLNRFGKEMYQQEHIRDNLDTKFTIDDIHYNTDWIDELKKELSDPAYKLLLWILSYEWYGTNKERNRKVPTVNQSAKYFNSTPFKIKKYWEELKNIWQKKEQDFS